VRTSRVGIELWCIDNGSMPKLTAYLADYGSRLRLQFMYWTRAKAFKTPKLRVQNQPDAWVNSIVPTNLTDGKRIPRVLVEAIELYLLSVLLARILQRIENTRLWL
jgi:hypothetical protein